MYILHTLSLALFSINIVYGYVSTSSAKFRQFLEHRENVTDKIAEYIEYERERLIALNKSSGYETDIEFAKLRIEHLTHLLEDVEKNRTESEKDSIDEIIRHPVKAYFIIKNFVANYRTNFKDKTVYGYKYDRILDCPDFNTPNITDQRDGIAAILRIQIIYDLSASDVMNGKLMGRNSPKLMPADAYVIGATAHNENFVDIAKDWLNIAWDSIVDDLSKATFNWRDALRRLILLKHTRYENKKVRELLDIGLKYDTENMFHKMYLSLRGNRLPHQSDKRRWYMWDVRRNLCNQKHTLPLNNTINLRCKYRPAMLEPTYLVYKEEVLNNKPYISIIHELLTDTEIESLIERATLNLTLPAGRERAYGEVASLDVIADNNSRLVSTKISNMFRYIPKSTNAPQVINYGIGGHRETEPNNLSNVLASLVIFLSDIEDSSHTIFSKLKISVQPKKGTMLYWYSKEVGDHIQVRRERYTCPVVFGEKWELETSIKAADYTKICKRRKKIRRT